MILDGGSHALKLNVPRGRRTLSYVNTLDMFESPAMEKLRYIEHTQNREDQYLARLLWTTQCWGVGNPFTRANSSPYMKVLFTLTLMNTTSYIAVEIYVWGVAESL